ncbi:MAG: DUF4230 domain-containing protein [Anaerolineae bacterium]
MSQQSDKPKRNLPEYIEITVPADDTLPPATNSNCLWGCGGMLAVTLIALGLLVGSIFIGFQGVLDSFTGFFRLPPVFFAVGEMNIPDDIYVPSVERVRAVSQLTTTEFNYAEVITGQREMPAWLSALYGDNVIMVAVGTITAGIDISQITEEDIQYDPVASTLTVTLPAPSLQTCFIDETQSYVVQRNVGFFGQPMVEMEDTVRDRALAYYRDTALEEGILTQAITDLETGLGDLLSVLVSDENIPIIINFEPQPADPLYPPTCDFEE